MGSNLTIRKQQWIYLSSIMDNKDYLDKLIDLQKVVKRIYYQIQELASEKRRINKYIYIYE